MPRFHFAQPAKEREASSDARSRLLLGVLPDSPSSSTRISHAVAGHLGDRACEAYLASIARR